MSIITTLGSLGSLARGAAAEKRVSLASRDSEVSVAHVVRLASEGLLALAASLDCLEELGNEAQLVLRGHLDLPGSGALRALARSPSLVVAVRQAVAVSGGCPDSLAALAHAASVELPVSARPAERAARAGG